MFVAEFTIALLLGSVLVIDAYRHAPGTESECTEPPTGIWMVQHNLQVEPGVYVNRYESVLNLTKSFDNAFIGNVLFLRVLNNTSSA